MSADTGTTGHSTLTEAPPPHPLEAFVGRELSAPEPFEVRAGAVRRFAEAIGGAGPEPGPPQSTAVPPTYAAVLSLEAAFSALADPRLAAIWSQLVHSSQRFDYRRPLRVGDRLHASVTVASVRRVAGNLLVDIVVELRDPAGALVCTSRTGLLVVAAEGGAGAA